MTVIEDLHDMKCLSSSNVVCFLGLHQPEVSSCMEAVVNGSHFPMEVAGGQLVDQIAPSRYFIHLVRCTR